MVGWVPNKAKGTPVLVEACGAAYGFLPWQKQRLCKNRFITVLHALKKGTLFLAGFGVDIL